MGFFDDISDGFTNAAGSSERLFSRFGDVSESVLERLGKTADKSLTAVENIATGLGNATAGLGSLLSNPIIWVGGIVLVVAIVPKLIKV
jgi:hypothetical protein